MYIKFPYLVHERSCTLCFSKSILGGLSWEVVTYGLLLLLYFKIVDIRELDDGY